MTIVGWFIFIMTASLVGMVGFAIAADVCDTGASKALTILICIVIIMAVLFGLLWYFNNTASGQRALIDQKSNLGNGIERTVTVYTANGEVIAQYEGLIDIETNDGGYVKFDFEGKRYIYYNCFVETIADIG
jgi:hypothetical protein